MPYARRTALAQEQGAKARMEKQLLQEQTSLVQAEHQLRDKENYADQALAAANADYRMQRKGVESKLAESTRQIQQLQTSQQNLQHQMEKQDHDLQQQVAVAAHLAVLGLLSSLLRWPLACQ